MSTKPEEDQEIEAVHEGEDAIVGSNKIFAGEVPVDGVIQSVLLDRTGYSGHFPQADPASQANDAGQENGGRNRAGVLLAQMRQAVGKTASDVDRVEDLGERHIVPLRALLQKS